MATCRDIIKRALRLLAVISSGREPDAGQAADGLEALRAMYGEWLAAEKFGPLTNVILDAAYTAGENERIANDDALQYAITFPKVVSDTDEDGQGITRQPLDRAVVLIAGATPQFFIYDRDQAKWTDVLKLGQTDQAPLSARFATGLAANLAVRMAPEYGLAPSNIVLAGAVEGERALGVRTFGRAKFDPALSAGAAFNITTG